MQQTGTPSLNPTYEALAAMLTPAEREILEALGEIIALDLLRQRDQEGTAHEAFETASVNLAKGRAC